MDQYNFLFKPKDIYEAFTFLNKKHGEMFLDLEKTSIEVHEEAQNKFQGQWDLETSSLKEYQILKLNELVKKKDKLLFWIQGIENMVTFIKLNLNYFTQLLKKQLIKYFSTYKYLSKLRRKHVFHAWRNYLDYKKEERKRIHQMKLYRRKHWLSKLFNFWRNNTITVVKQKMTNQWQIRIESEVEIHTKEFESIICQLQDHLQNKILELRKEEELHQSLHTRYNSIIDDRNRQIIDLGQQENLFTQTK